MARTRRRQGYLEQYNSKNGKWERVRSPQPAAKPAAKPATTAAPKPTANNPFISGKPNPNAVMTGVKGAVQTLKGAKGLLGAAGTAAAIVPTAMSVLNPKDNILTRLGKLGNSIEKAVGPGGGGGMQPQKQNLSGGRYVPGSQQGKTPTPAASKPQPTAPKSSASNSGTTAQPQTTQRRVTQAPSSSSSGGGTRSSTPAPKPAAKPAAKPTATAQRRVSASTANREAGNYGTSRTNNPMIDDAMKSRMRQREEKAGVGPVKDGAQYSADVKSSTRGVGPVADGGKYAGNLKPSTSNTTTAKKKEDETKTMSIAERIRRRRAGLA